ncbi:MAG: hypothetical protein PHW01_04585 [Patescibacteria group bacterium]|nr:hypothetical protein [Patescibacteria group bacterium]
MLAKRISKIKLIIAIFLIAFGAIGRIILKDIPNVETVMVASLLAGSLLGGAYTVIVPLTIIALTDMYIGNDLILIFTWSAWAMIGFFGWLVRKKRGYSYKFILSLTGMGIAASLFFYLYTNFGVWLLWDMYPHTLLGLIQCYFMGLPFLRNNLVSDLIFIPTTSAALVLFLKYYSIKKRAIYACKQKT